jgi:hypothetical protein
VSRRGARAGAIALTRTVVKADDLSTSTPSPAGERLCDNAVTRADGGARYLCRDWDREPRHIYSHEAPVHIG